MKTAELRKAMKARIPDARVASTGDSSWTVRFESPAHITTIRVLIKELQLAELGHDVEGSQTDWSYVFYVTKDEA